jgi:type II secretory pathway pseudopilin PulG
MVQLVALVMLAIILPAGAPPALAQTSEEIQALRKTVDALRESQQRIERELAEIKALLIRARQAGAPDDNPKNVVLSIDGDPFKGERTAKLVLVDFTDYQ